MRQSQFKTNVSLFLGRYYRPQCKLSHCSPCETRHPNFEGKTDGNYPYDPRRCNSFYKCDGERSTNVYCPSGTVFDRVKKEPVRLEEYARKVFYKIT